MKKKGIIVCMIMCLVMSFAFGAGSKEVVDKGVTTVKIALWDYDIPGSVYPALFAAFEKANPDLKVEVVNAPSNDYETKLTTMLASGDDIDVFLAKSNTSYPILVQQQFAEDMGALAKKNDFDLAPYGSVLEQHYVLDGTLYALPLRINDWVVFYNKNLFDQAGVPYPTNDMTWEQYFEIGKKISKDDIYGAAFFPKTGFIVPVLIGAVDNFDIGSSDFKLLVPAAKKLKAAMDEGAWENYAESVSLSKDQTFFFLGKWGMIYDGSWLTQMLVARGDALGFDFGIVKSPYWEGTKKNGFATSTPVLINTSTKKKAAAWKLASFMTGPEGAKIVAESMLVPGYMTNETMNVFKTASRIDESQMVALTNNVSYALGDASIYLGLLSGAFNQELELFLTDNQSAEKMAENLNKRRTEIFAQY